jgi:glutathione S-transferase
VGAARALRYTRDRICVPRDMGVTAARQLRAALNEIADGLDPAGEGAAVPIDPRDRRDVDPTRFGTQKL